MNDLDELIRSSLREDRRPLPELAPWREIEQSARSVGRIRARRGFVIGAATIAVASGLLFSGSLDRAGPSPLEHASAAVVDWPPNQILHMRIVMTSNFNQPDFVEESWQLTSPPYTLRTRDAFPANGTGAQVVESAEDANGLGQ
jgi:hypothetical protein